MRVQGRMMRKRLGLKFVRDVWSDGPRQGVFCTHRVALAGVAR